MKQKVLFLMVMALVLCAIGASAQSKEYKVEDDGFEWYKIHKDGKYGAEDKYGNVIVPMSYDFVMYFNGFFRVVKSSKEGLKEGLIDLRGKLIVPIEYTYILTYTTAKESIPYISVHTKGYLESGIYNIYGRCLIPVSRGYKDIFQRDGNRGEDCVYYECYHKDGQKSICDASGKVVFTNTRGTNIDFHRDKKTGKYAIAIYEDGNWVFVDKNENVLWNTKCSNMEGKWPIRIRKGENSPYRNLTQTELNRVLFKADFLDGNKKYFANLGKGAASIPESFSSSSSSKVYPYSYSYDSSTQSHIYKMDKAVSLAGIASMQMQISKNSEGIQLMLDLFETKSNSVIASWANKANRQGGTIDGVGDVTLNLSNGKEVSVFFALQDRRNELTKTNDIGLIYIFMPLSFSNSASPLLNELSTYDIKSITYDNKTFQIDVPTAATIKSMFDKIKDK